MSQWDFIENKINELEKRIEGLEKGVEIRDTYISEFFAIVVEEIDLTSRARFYLIMAPQSTKEQCLENLETFLKREKRIFDKNPNVKEMLLDFFQQRMPIYKTLILTHSITFDEFSEMVIRIFSIELAKKLFPMETIIRLFRSENAQRWKHLAS